VIIEYYTDMQKIYDDAEYVLREWGEDWHSMWTLARPEGFRDFGLPSALSANAQV
jgi:hypothetical protein